MSSRLGLPKVGPPHTEKDKLRITKVEHAYFTDRKVLFDRETLEKISKILSDYRGRESEDEDEDPPTLEIPDYVDGKERPYKIMLDLDLVGERLTSLVYIPIQWLVNPYWARRKLGIDNDNEILNPTENIIIRSSVGNATDDEKADCKQKWKETHENWKGSRLRAEFLKKFNDICQKNRIRIKKVIAFGTGSLLDKYLGPYDDDKEDENDDTEFENCAIQHLVIHELQKCLQREYDKKTPKETVQLFSQEPMYDREDEETVLKDLQIERRHDPDGLLEIDNETLVFSIYPDLALLQFIADTAKPAMILYKEIPEDVEWDNYKLAKLDKEVQVCPANAEAHDQTSPRVQRLIQNYEKHDLPFPTGILAAEKTKLYVRK